MAGPSQEEETGGIPKNFGSPKEPKTPYYGHDIAQIRQEQGQIRDWLSRLQREQPNKNLIIAIGIIAVLGIGLALVGIAKTADVSTKVGELSSDLTAQEDQYKRLELRIAEVKDSINTLEQKIPVVDTSRIEEISAEMSKINTGLRSIEEIISGQQERIKKIEEEISELRKPSGEVQVPTEQQPPSGTVVPPEMRTGLWWASLENYNDLIDDICKEIEDEVKNPVREELRGGEFDWEELIDNYPMLEGETETEYIDRQTERIVRDLCTSFEDGLSVDYAVSRHRRFLEKDWNIRIRYHNRKAILTMDWRTFAYVPPEETMVRMANVQWITEMMATIQPDGDVRDRARVLQMIASGFYTDTGEYFADNWYRYTYGSYWQ
ncbi:MAG: hypothetical protein DRO11_00100 [Methanobacteriota archaeon]|nr:MAG: hypothetical protein DRO11_00100 [Euryarchaeota archaeon]